MKKYDYIVIGSGPVANSFSSELKDSNKKVLIVEGDAFGGICPNYGCEPKIFLEGAVKTVLMSRQLSGKGISQPATINWEDLMKRKKQTFEAHPENAIKGMQSNHADTLIGTASFIDSHTLKVNGEEIYGEKIVIATGQKPNKLPIEGSELTFSSNDVLSLDYLPKNVVLIGGGYIGMELAVILNAAGAHVEIVEFADRALTAFYWEHVKDVVQEMEDQGIIFHFNHAVSNVEKNGEKYVVASKQGLTIETDYVVDASGRVPNIDNLNLDEVGIEHDRGGVLVNDYLETNVKGVYAAGDVVSKDPLVAPKLTPTSAYEGEYLSDYFEGKTDTPIKYPVIGSAAFTFPQIAQAGVSVSEALENEDYEVVHHDLTSDYFYTGTNDYNAKLTLVFDHNNRLVGASEVSQTAADDINNFIDIIGMDVDKREWKETFLPIFPAISYKTRIFI
ncbi:NAD(P)/FAD-dependent oxidoreductase [Virgibacillus sp. NKC19-3]|uniref:dihydrolipoyl dehydrogenase family protein n=1 Tax=Virgibacillus saliphilus TaxID=2831674 RepID=UPI001C9A72BE|nr:NAD(P)/FAD-dependent oxidoreductase [Virgibacillus sp. NKC19-3]MBY7142496.1 NAD(P)/FAD-dependent oxidoreductase [Virgibacillus sp. NKC19-3]